MATTGEKIEVTTERRSVEAYLSMPLGEDGQLTLYRQIVLRNADGVLLGSPSRDNEPIVRKASQIAATNVVVDGQTVSGAMAMTILAAFFDKFDDEDQGVT